VENGKLVGKAKKSLRLKVNHPRNEKKQQRQEEKDAKPRNHALWFVV